VDGGNYHFIGDSILEPPSFLYNFHLKPARIALGTNNNRKKIGTANPPLYHCSNKNILILDANYIFQKTIDRYAIEVVVLSKNSKITIDSLVQYFSVKQIVADASNPVWKIRLWEKDCKKLDIPFYATAEKGAFIVNL
jgi:hypothetical protein